MNITSSFFAIATYIMSRRLAKICESCKVHFELVKHDSSVFARKSHRQTWARCGWILHNRHTYRQTLVFVETFQSRATEMSENDHCNSMNPPHAVSTLDLPPWTDGNSRLHCHICLHHHSCHRCQDHRAMQTHPQLPTQRCLLRTPSTLHMLHWSWNSTRWKFCSINLVKVLIMKFSRLVSWFLWPGLDQICFRSSSNKG